MVTTDEICDVIIFGGDLLNNWMKIELTDPVQKFTQKFLHGRVARFLVRTRVTDTCIITINQDSLPGPVFAPQPNTENYNDELLYMNRSVW